MRVNKWTFSFFCETLGPNIKEFDTPITTSVDVETKIVIIIAKLATCNTLFMIGYLYDIAESTASIVVWEWCKAIKDKLLLIVIEKMIIEKTKKISTEFEAIKNKPYVIFLRQ